MKRLSILGATGSIGRNTLEVIAKFADRFKVVAVTAKHNLALLAEQVRCFQPELAVVYDQQSAGQLERMLAGAKQVQVLYGAEGYLAAAAHPRVDMVVAAMVGAAGLKPALAAIESKKDIALANKETLVMAGAVVMKAAQANGVQVLPVDSEHSAIFQCLHGNHRADMARIFLTASGGPFRTKPLDQFPEITVGEALDHPTWQMGSKITIDSATLMNKGLEVIEAQWLFNVPYASIEVVIHPQSIIHSMVGYKDGSVLAQLGLPDMKTAIAYALSYPDRLPLDQALPEFKNIGVLTFEAPDLQRFPCLALALQAGDVGETAPAVLNAANEVAVEAFLKQAIAFTQIPEVIDHTLQAHSITHGSELGDIIMADQWARATAATQVENLAGHALANALNSARS